MIPDFPLPILFITLGLSLIINAFLLVKNKHLEKQHDYYVELDEENERLRKQITKLKKPRTP